MHGTVMMFLFAVPVVEAMGVMLLPQMLGARDLPFPRLSAYAFWAYFIGGHGFLRHAVLRSRAVRRLVHVSAADGKQIFTRYRRRLLAAWHRLHRDIRHRRRDRDHRRRPAHARARHVARKMPIFAWTMLIFAGMIVFAFPAMILATIMLELERALRLALLHRRQGRRPAAVAASVLVLRPPRGLHHLPARRRHGVDDRSRP